MSQLKREFTKYSLKYVAGMTSTYAIRLYEILAQHQFRNKKEVELTLCDLREKMQTDGKHSLFGNLNNRVIKPAIEQINEHSNFNASYTTLKSGRKVVGILIRFEFKENRKPLRVDNTEDFIGQKHSDSEQDKSYSFNHDRKIDRKSSKKPVSNNDYGWMQELRDDIALGYVVEPDHAQLKSDFGVD
nr:replication initiation protein [Methylomarinum sp. Ch1-1]MDP4523239.1 replication initiation protein [Methylomarinum sp. Ch1-1]